MTTVGMDARPGPAAAYAAPAGLDWPRFIFLAAFPIALVAYLAVGWSMPLWFDEAFTGTIAGQEHFAGLVSWCLSEMTGPAFYMPMWAWAKLAGVSDTALRIPPFVLAMTTPLLIVWRGHGDRDVRLFWAALTLLWLPMLPMATEARPYPQLVFLCVLQAIAFMKVARQPRLGAAMLWSTASSLAILTHYYAAATVVFQGLALIVLHRREWRRLALALLPFAAAAVWIAFHFRFLFSFASGFVAYYDPIPAYMLLGAPLFLFGYGVQGPLVIGLVAITWRLWWDRARSITPESLLVWTALAAFALVLGAGAFRATLQPRYLTPAVPALLFGLACWAKRLWSNTPAPVALAFAGLFAAMIAAPILDTFDDRTVYRRESQFETASAWLGERKVERLHFLWSTAAGGLSASARLAELAGFFFKRSGHPVKVLVSRSGEDPDAALLKAAGHDDRAAILWLASNPLPSMIRPKIADRDATWECRDFGSRRFLVYACRRRTVI